MVCSLHLGGCKCAVSFYPQIQQSPIQVPRLNDMRNPIDRGWYPGKGASSSWPRGPALGPPLGSSPEQIDEGASRVSDSSGFSDSASHRKSLSVPLGSPPFDQKGLEFNTVDLIGQLHTSVQIHGKIIFPLSNHFRSLSVLTPPNYRSSDTHTYNPAPK